MMDCAIVTNKTDKFLTVGYSNNSIQKPKFFSNADYYFTKGEEADDKGKKFKIEDI